MKGWENKGVGVYTAILHYKQYKIIIMKQEQEKQQAPALPSCEDMELAVVMAIIAQSGSIEDVAERLQPHMFVNADYRLVYRAAVALRDREAGIDMVSIEHEMYVLEPEQAARLEGLSFIADHMLTVRNAAHIRTYAASVVRCWVLRELCKEMKEQTFKAHEPDADVTGLLADIGKKVEKLEDFFAVTSTTRAAGEVGRQVLDTIYREQELKAAGQSPQLSTGIDEFDRSLGGLYRGELLVLAGRPSMGKTALGLHIALGAARSGKRVCFFSLEMTERQLISRLLCMLSDVAPDKLRFKQLDPDDCDKLDQAAAQLERLPLYLNYCSGCTFEEIRAKTLATHRRQPFDLIIVDYLNLVNVVSGGRADVRDTMDLALGDVCRRLKNLIMEADVAGMVLAQLNRNCEARVDHVPVMSDLRNSGEIEQIADSVAFVYRPEQYREYYDKNTKESLRGVGQLFVAKNRNGATGEIRFRYNSSLTKIMPYKKEDEE